jgi:hypothetical protein
MIALNDAKDMIECEVFYVPLGQADRPEKGVITKVNDAGMIFVRFGDDRYSKACRPTDLYLERDLDHPFLRDS